MPRVQTPQAALFDLEKTKENVGPDAAEAYEDLAEHYRHRMAILGDDSDGLSDGANPESYKALRRSFPRSPSARTANCCSSSQRARRISDELLRELERELDLGEARLAPKQR